MTTEERLSLLEGQISSLLALFTPQQPVRFWQGMSRTDVVNLLDKIMVGVNQDGTTKYTDVNKLVNLISSATGSGIEAPPTPGTVLPAPEQANKITVLPSGNYTQPGGGTLTVDPLTLTIGFWDGQSWTKPIVIPTEIDTSVLVAKSVINQPNGVAGLDENGELPGYVSVSEKGAAGGVAPLDQNLKTPVEYIPPLPYASESDFNPVKSYVNDIKPLLIATDIEGYLIAFLDSENHLLGGWRSDGSFDVPKLLDASVSFAKLKEDATELMLKSINPDTGYIGGWFDSENRILLGIKSNGQVNIPSLSTGGGAIFSQLNVEDTGYIAGWFDSEGKILFGIKSNGHVVFINDDVEDLKSRVSVLENGDTGIKLVDCVGDSLTAATYPDRLSALLGSGYQVMNRGVGGENVPTIAARVGAVPAVLSSDIILPASSLERVLIASYDVVTNRLKNQYDGRTVNWIRPPANTLNPVFVADIECELIIEGAPDQVSTPDTKIYLRRLVNSDSPTQLKAGMPIYTVTAAKYKKPYAGVYWMGQNRGYDIDGVDDNSVLIDYYRRLIEFLGTPNYIIIGLHTNSANYRADLESLMLREFGLRYINLRQYMTLYGLKDANLTPTPEDITAMAQGMTPPQLLSDGIHFTGIGYQLIAELVYKRMKQLNIA
ncbi:MULTISPECIES: hypothetical protein [Olivibacter]|uniref:SGNH/GDSL hydrolase family protein n=1 Tax=Olivibacter jilunii TaxID=985016 RepID=A0ABW6AYV3_9SPHI